MKEQYAQARQHETRQTTATTFLTATAGLLLGFAFKEGLPRPEMWWIGLVVSLVGVADWWINRAHFKGNRFHTSAAGATRRSLEDAIGSWTVKKPTEIRKEVPAEYGLRGPNISIGKSVHQALALVPCGVIMLGLFVAVIARWC